MFPHSPSARRWIVSSCASKPRIRSSIWNRPRRSSRNSTPKRWLKLKSKIHICGGVVLFLALAACRNDMHDQPRYKPLAGSDFFSDHRAARPAIEGTVARGHLRIDEARYTGKIGGEDIDLFPI